jgi:3-phenylpropionate/trans-cinnamate dioxygenase ferredoxin reductase subunit
MTTSPTFAIVGGDRAGAEAAEALCDTELPYFFTNRYDLGMEYVGHAPDYEKVVIRGDVEKRSRKPLGSA